MKEPLLPPEHPPRAVRSLGACAGFARHATTAVALCACLLSGSAAHAQLRITDIDLKKQANGVLALMGYMLTPDVTTGSLSISNADSGNPGFRTTSIGGGFTISRERPLYLEGTAAYARYDPTFIASDSGGVQKLPVKWEAVSGTAGVGWDFGLTEELVLRPIFNFSLGYVASDLSILNGIARSRTSQDTDFLDDGRLDSYGVGGSLMLDYEHYRPEGEADVELRYTDIYLNSYAGTSKAVQGTADAQSLALWTRWRAPTGLTALERPLRYVLEFAHTEFLGDLRGALGFSSLTSVGAGFELDSSKYDVFVTRTRLLLRYKFGNYVQGWSVGLAVSF